jgi:hypothetical protein
VDGAPQRVHLERAAARGHRAAIEALARVPELPEEGEYLWQYFLEVSLGRGAGPMGASGLSYRDVEAWCRLMDRRLAPHEVQALLLLDSAVRDPGELEEDE